MDTTPQAARLRELFERALDGSESRERVLRLARLEDPRLEQQLSALLDRHDAPDSRLDELDTRAAARLLVLSPAVPSEPSTIGKFRVERRLGAGGMGVVYLAHDPELERHVAIKLLWNTPWSGPIQKTLLDEARATSRLDHPSIATVYDVGWTEDGCLFMAMPYYAGETLAKRLSGGPIPLADALTIALAISDALRVAHASGIVHRDVKPANVMLLPDGAVRVLDFGIAQIREPGGLAPPAQAGTLAYMSPEARRGEAVDARTDVWAIGVVLSEMLTGHHPRLSRHTSQRHRGTGHPKTQTGRTSIPHLYRRVIDRCLADDPEDRYPDAGAVASALRGAQRRLRILRGGLLVGSVLAISAVVGSFLVTGADPSDVAPAASLIALLPLSTAPADTALARVGTELAVTLGLNLDGVGGIRVIDPLTLLSGGSAAAIADRAASLGATSVLQGSISRLGESVRVEVELVPTGRDEALVRATAIAPAGDVVTLTDSLTWSVLSGIWRSGTSPTPSLSGITTRSLEALQPFLAGERAISEGRLRAAPSFFREAVEADSTFWLAHWRYWWSSAWHGNNVPPGVRAAVMENLTALPARDSALAVAWSRPAFLDREASYREVELAFPSDWLARFVHQDQLVHDGGYFGYTLEESRALLETVVRFNPELVRAWDHLFWVSREQRDTIRMSEVVAQLSLLGYDSISLEESGFDELEYFSAQTRILNNRGSLPPADAERAVEFVRDMHGPSPPLRLATNLFSEGFSLAQLEASTQLLQGSSTTHSRAAAHFGRSLALAARGRWTEGLAAAEAHEQLFPTLLSSLTGLRLAAVGTVFAGIDAETLERWDRRVGSHPEGATPAVLAERTWLLSLAGRPRPPVSQQTVSPFSPLLERAQRAVRLGTVAGTRPETADSLELVAADAARAGFHRRAPEHPFFDGVIRLVAARQLRAQGDPARAAALLTWYEAVLPDRRAWMTIRANRVLEPLAQLERVHVELALGRHDRARWHYGRATEHLDGAAGWVAREVEAARSALETATRSR